MVNAMDGRRWPRLVEGYRHRFRVLLARVRPRRLEFGVDLLLGRARERAAREGVPLPAALEQLYRETRRRVHRRLEVTGACTVPAAPPRFLCDGSLRGLARWLRAAGHEAEADGAPGDALLARARAEGRTLVTGDTRVLARRVVRDGTVPVVWLPTAPAAADQVDMLLGDLDLPRRRPRCMACGGALAPVAKEDVLDRIPPRTRGWKDEYFACAGCGKLFWEGTHWERIARRLERAR
jgi:uncharacterized protein with PIN domain